MIDSIEFDQQKSLAIRVVNLVSRMVGFMYGSKNQGDDEDQNPYLKSLSKKSSEDSDKKSIELAIKARQSQSDQLQSYNDLARTLAEKNSKVLAATERMKEV